MEYCLQASKNNPPLGALLVGEYAKKSSKVTIEWGQNTAFKIDNKVIFTNQLAVCQYMVRVLAPELYSNDVLATTEMNNWCNFATTSLNVNANALQDLNNALATRTFLVGNGISLADLQVYATLFVNKSWIDQKKSCKYNHVCRWYDFISDQDCVREAVGALPQDYKAKLVASKPEKTASGNKDEGKFIELEGAKMGEVVVRFPPEASGFLHIGHAKAALLNQHYQKAFKGKLIMRFDDTNPAKEKADFEKVILEDLKLLQVYPDIFTHTSDHFEVMLKYCELLINQSKAYVDDTEPEKMKNERETRTESVNRNNSVEKNMKMWGEMLKGSDAGQKCCVRAKIDMNSDNGCMRDPAIYRCKDEPHVRTGHKYKVYPTYDFACPIVDSLEGVTHALRTTEYHDRDDQFFWFIDALGLRKPFIWEYSRLNMMNTVLSKRKLTWFVDQQLVDGWDDPRFPTVRGVLRRGMTVEGLRQFIVAQGSSRSVVMMDWDKIWAFNKKVIDPVASRYTALEKDQLVPVSLSGVKEGKIEAQLHPKNEALGSKTIHTSSKVFIEAVDAETLKEGVNATFINWGNLKITKINRNANGKVESVEATPNLDDKDYKKTVKLTWFSDMSSAPLIPCVCVYFDHIISKSVLGKDEDFKDFINNNSKVEVLMLGEPELKNVKKCEIIQLQRKGFFICDEPYEDASRHSGRESPIVLYFIPDGSSKQQTPFSGQQQQQQQQKQVKTTDSQAKKSKNEQTCAKDPANLNQKIIEQGNKVRDLKANKASKEAVDKEVKTLLAFKADFKAASGKDWKPGVQGEPKPSPTASNSSSADPFTINQKIVEQGDTVRKLKSEKASKEAIDSEVNKLLALKAEFKQAAGKDWKPGVQVEPKAAAIAVNASADLDPAAINQKIVDQGNKIRQLKSDKASKVTIELEVKTLLSLKEDFKKASGQDWKPGVQVVPKSTPSAAIDSNSVNLKIVEQGNKVRDLKSKKADKAAIDQEVKTLLALKSQFKELAGKDWKPGAVTTQKVENKMVATSVDDPEIVKLKADIDVQGQIVRELKSSNGDKAKVDAEVQKLLALKADYKAKTGQDLAPAANARKGKKDKKQTNEAKNGNKAPQTDNKVDDKGAKKVTRLGLEATKEDNLPEWYSQIITKSEMIEYYDVSGCYILRPWAYSLWEKIVEKFDADIKGLGVRNCYFPMFVSQNALEKEKCHISDFAPEVAWVTKSGESDLAEPIAIRPTSETVMYPAYAKWIQSHRDLPLKLNQWCSVVRWEFKHPQPFLRTREFLWQEGHTAHANKQDAVDEVHTILDLYGEIYTDLLAIPVIKGRKTEKEKFAGGDFTTTVEVYIHASGRAIQGATSHHLGQNFSKMFEIEFEDPKTKQKQNVYQNSWGITTRTIGVMTMVHGDNKGLVLPPRAACYQVVIIPCGITASLPQEDKTKLFEMCETLEQKLKCGGVRVMCDIRDNYSPGWKFNHWELKGVPIRIEIGPRDMKQSEFVMVRRDNGDKKCDQMENAAATVNNLLEEIHKNMYDRALNVRNEHVVVCKDWAEFCANLENKCLIQAPYCGIEECEDAIKKDSAREEASEPGAPSMGAKSLCIPFDQPAKIDGTIKCIHPKCSRKPQFYTLFGRSY